MSFDVLAKADRVERAFRVAADRLPPRLRDAGAELGRRYIGFHRAQRLRGRTAGGRGVRGTRRGLLSQFAYQVTGQRLSDIQVKIGTRSRVALEHELGIVRRAPAGRNLRIPFSSITDKGRLPARVKKLLRESGEVLQASRSGFELVRRTRKGRQITRRNPLVRIESGSGTYLAEIVNAKGNKPRDRLRLLFHLHPQAVIPARLDFRALFRSWNNQALAILARGAGLAISDAQGGR